MVERERGRVKWFSGAKGYGFIERPNGDSVFVHYSGIMGGGYRQLLDDQLVEYEIVPGSRSPLAINVTVVG